MKRMVAFLRRLSLLKRMLLFLALSAAAIGLVIWLKPVHADGYTNAGINQLYWVGTTFVIGYFAVVCFKRSGSQS